MTYRTTSSDCNIWYEKCIKVKNTHTHTHIYIYIYIYVYIYLEQLVLLFQLIKIIFYSIIKNKLLLKTNCHHLYITTIFNINYIFLCVPPLSHIFEQICYNYSSISIISHSSSKEY